MHDIAETAMMFVTQAAKYSDRAAFNIPQAFEILYDTIGLEHPGQSGIHPLR